MSALLERLPVHEISFISSSPPLPPNQPTNTQPLTLPEYRKMDISKLPLKEQRRYWKLLNRQVIKEKNAAGQKL